MKIFDFKDMQGGWFVGNFEPTAHKADFEVGYKHHRRGEPWPEHYHKRATEINFLICGVMKINDQILRAGDIFVIPPNFTAKPEFISDCTLVVIKTVSDPNDKYEI